MNLSLLYLRENPFYGVIDGCWRGDGDGTGVDDDQVTCPRGLSNVWGVTCQAVVR